MATPEELIFHASTHRATAIQAPDISLFRWTSALLLTGGIIFWIGAFTPPSRWWMTRDTAEYLQIIHEHRTTWIFIAITFTVGIIISMMGMQLLNSAMNRLGEPALHQLASLVYAFATIL
jgi:hypothetical protein